MATARVALVLAGHCLVIHRPHLSSTSIVHVHRPSLPRGETPSSKAMKETTTTAPRASASTPAATNSNKTTAAIPATNKADRYEEPRPFSSNEREARGITGRPLSAFDQFKNLFFRWHESSLYPNNDWQGREISLLVSPMNNTATPSTVRMMQTRPVQRAILIRDGLPSSILEHNNSNNSTSNPLVNWWSLV